LYVLVGILLVACNEKRSGENEAVTDSTYTVINRIDTGNLVTDPHYFWEARADDESSRTLLRKSRPLDKDSLTAPVLVSMINERYQGIELQLVKISGDTIFTRIKNATLLTNQMGSSGADIYLTEACFNLTELPGIHYVHIDFKEGEHASPGTYSRIDFVNVRFN
ncbi:MAG TPA: hypothetical protein VHL77_01715, partial [Ferruginibacter sp.]|nr:hypothetical protein [Ferruginibacter sp.]